ncbi:DEAD-box ATP-dependent RNA helicase CshA-like isoform X2 [Daktulosphaira vitifoliae]|uniref:DEAD-box ATP-dependent RNA helicase CshA-like isoform X2 n=1 Tax=Daktulosphaira vitifoliae TaxID=58002 RepID=UPI0021AA9BD1|nr:DEAD-box ATP-dependent RNA helicase CshA-like isoform X2 [Daktulosphaira vitifoliae]XP_050520404.1 DEAD-box ATP-dependent RNA helicase CshA-like isoform X2 [Daktulosphaira vitifoliae]
MPVSEYANNTNRTSDVQTCNKTPFSTLISDSHTVLNGLTSIGFMYASPIQVAALPTIIGGQDTIVEAKNGTGKTLTFVIPILMKLKVDQPNLQSIVLAPTREIAVQIQQCFKKVGTYIPDLKCEYFIGGTSVEEDRQKVIGCQIAVGSPGRIKHLLNEHVLKGIHVKTFVLDEVDRMFTDKNFTKDVWLIDGKLPKLKQKIVVSASIDKTIKFLFDEFMEEYTIVKGTDEDMNATQDPKKFLLGIKQYVACVKAVSTNIILLPAKNLRLLNILRNLPHTQCIIFTNFMTRVEAVCNMLRDHDYKADYIRGDQDQNIRLKLVDRLVSFKSKILVATDLVARGIDSSNVDLVINMDCPRDWATYLHRIGRAGRFGNKGYCVTILDDDKELMSFKEIVNSIENINIKMLPIVIEKSILDYKEDELEDLNLKFDSASLIDNDNKDNLPDKEETQINSEIDNHVIEKCKNDISENEKKSIYGPGISENESLQKLREVVNDTENKLISENAINKRHLTANRSFVLFDPEPLFDDSAQYMKYNPDELVDIFKNYDSDIVKYEAAKKLKPKNQIVINDNCEKNDFKETNYFHSNNFDKSSNENNSNISNVNPSNQKYTDIFDLFQIPDISQLKSSIFQAQTEQLFKEISDIENSDHDDYVDSSLKLDEEDKNDSNEFCSDEEYFDEDWEDLEEVEEIYDKNDSTDDSESNTYSGNSYRENEIENNVVLDKSSQNEYEKKKHPMEINNHISQIAYGMNSANNNLLDYNLLNNWYQEWNRQLNVIQTYSRLGN